MRGYLFRNCRSAAGLEIGVGFVELGLLLQSLALDLDLRGLSGGSLFKPLDRAVALDRS